MYNDHMKTMSVTEFKAHCLEMVNEVHRTGEPLLLTKRGKPTAMVGPAPAEPKKKWPLGLFRNEDTVVGDLVEPLDLEWEALTDSA